MVRARFVLVGPNFYFTQNKVYLGWHGTVITDRTEVDEYLRYLRYPASDIDAVYM
jgi:poly-D-alanine transfer protein DltD